MLLLDWLVRYTLTGMAMRAISYNRLIVPLMGVPVNRVISMTFAIGSAIAGAGGLLYGLAYPVLDPYMGIRIGWWAFIAAVVGGIGNIRGAVLGGYYTGRSGNFHSCFAGLVHLSGLRGFLNAVGIIDF